MSKDPFDLNNPGDLNADGRTDSAFSDAFDADGDGVAESVAGDVNLDGNVDSVYSDLDGDGFQETAFVDSNLDGTLDAIWLDLDGDLLPDTSVPIGPFAVTDTGAGAGVGLDACAPESIYDPGTGLEADGITFLDPFAPVYTDTGVYDPTGAGSGYADPALYTATTPGVSDAYLDPSVDVGMDPAIDTSGFTDLSWDAWNASMDYDSLSWDAWNSGDYAESAYLTDMSGDWADYSSAMDSLANDPTDSTSWDYAYDAAESASWDAWNASVDAYVAGDYEAAYDYNSQSIDASSVADSTWDSWSDSTSYDSGY